MKTNTHGGKRPNSGRKAGSTSGRKDTTTIRLDREVAKVLKTIKIKKKYNNYSELISYLLELYAL